LVDDEREVVGEHDGYRRIEVDLDGAEVVGGDDLAGADVGDDLHDRSAVVERCVDEDVAADRGGGQRGTAGDPGTPARGGAKPLRLGVRSGPRRRDVGTRRDRGAHDHTLVPRAAATT